ncbi:hypothetical protein ACFPRL_30820 [Pseudoclavibacter helvolus]
MSSEGRCSGFGGARSCAESRESGGCANFSSTRAEPSSGSGQ